jgi:hypothetical protein
MIAIVGILFLGLVVAGMLVLRFLRTWVLDEEATEARLRDPETHTLSYVVPNGRDPADFMSALAHAKFTCVTDAHAGVERVLIACEESERAHVRRVLEEAGPAGSGTQPNARPHVIFDDEPDHAAT